MRNLFNICCKKEPSSKENIEEQRLIEEKNKMEQMNGHIIPATCPFTGESVDSHVNNNNHVNNKQVKPNLRVKVPQPIRLKNHLLLEENYDILHSRMDDVLCVNQKCSDKVCESSRMDIPSRSESTPRTVEEVYHDAEAFLKEYFSSINRENSEAHRLRLEDVKNELNEKGTYQLKTSELVFGTKLAWRNASRCIGRIQWKKLQTFDCREVTTASGMFEALCNHIKYSTNKGNVRSAITIFPQRTDGKHDYRIWNPQLINYAGYVQPDGTILGDPARVEFTEICIRLGWKPPMTAWDILPLVLSADGKDPEFFEIPREIIMEVQMEHPKYDWFKELGLRWYVVPAVANMKLDCGGLEFTATAFNGWYMGTEVASRNFCDANRYNITETVALKMGLDTNSYVSLWKDKALVEINVAVLHSFHRDNASIVDHHSASEQFMKHLDNENKSRGGCPADWIWIVPPMSSSLTAVFHQEMALYYLKPAYDYQEPAWKTHQWTKPGHKPVTRKFHFRQIARAVKFTSKLFGRALSRRIKATILYASETGKSEQYAKELGTIFGYAFNAQVHCMSEYDMFSIEHETLLLIVTSTFGNGEPPANGMDFAEHLFRMLYNEQKSQRDQTGDLTAGSAKLLTPKSLMRTNSLMAGTYEEKKPLVRLESNKSSIYGASSVDNIAPLSNVCYAVFALGSSAYPKFCNFGKTVDKILNDLGGERILELACGDEMYGQEQQFRNWSSNIFHVACETFCLEENDMVKDAKNAFGTVPLTEQTVRFVRPTTNLSLKGALEAGFRKQLTTCKTKKVKNLGECTTDRTTIFVEMETTEEVKYDPGDHVGIMSCNRKDIVTKVLERLKDVDNYDMPVQLQVMKETLTATDTVKTWERHERIPPVTVRDLFTRFVDITTPPSTTVLKYLAKACSDEQDKEQIMELIMDSNKYDDWHHYHNPHLAEVLEQFQSCRPHASLLAALLPPLQPRFYSISSSPLVHAQRIHVTVAVVVYKTRNGEGPFHYGVCSTYLQSLQPGDEVLLFVRRAPTFHLPKDISAPLILVGPGSGIAPFRGFWHHRRHQIMNLQQNHKKQGPVWLYFGCRNRCMDLYKDEKEEALNDGVLSRVMLALSRENGKEKKHVQTLLEETSDDIARMLLTERGHFYVCGDCKMAEDVQQKLKGIIKKQANMNDQEADNFIATLMDENRYHEDIFGITLRTAEVRSACRESARRTRLESTQSQS